MNKAEILRELIAEMVAAEETAAAARLLVSEYMGANGIKSETAAGHKVAYVAPGYTTKYSDEMKNDAAVAEARAAYNAARAPYAYKCERAAYIRVSKAG